MTDELTTGGSAADSETSAGSPMALVQTRAESSSSRERRGDKAPGPPPKRYDDKGSLGKGGMGDVRLCRDAYVGRDVALKTLQPEAALRRDLRARFEREARVQGQLEHPSIVPVYDLAFGDDGIAFFTMKRVRGHTLTQVLRGLRRSDAAFAHLTLRKRLAAFQQACLAIAFAHARGVIHRDLKPSNIMLGDFGEVYVLDWGIAKVAGESDVEATEAVIAASDADATAVGAHLGTPGYMSPEMVRGEHDTLDARSDVYALGAILFALLSLHPLNDAGTTEAQLEATVTGVEARLSKRFPEVSDVPPELEAMCVRATAVDRDERYPTVRALVDDIERFLEGDRDAARRRELATQHLETARRREENTSSDDPLAERAAILSEVNRALAIDPTNGDALAAMVRLTVEPPPVVPPEVDAELEAIATRERRGTERIGAMLYALSAALLILVALWGVRSVAEWAVCLAAVSVASVIAAYASTRRGLDRLAFAALIAISSSSAIGAMSLLFGPYFFAPTLAVPNTMILALHTPRGLPRVGVFVLGVAVVLVPIALEAAGVLPPSISIEGGVVHLLPRMVTFGRGPTLLFLTITNTLLVVAPTLLVTAVRDRRLASDRKTLLHTWQLRQLVPEGARRRSTGRDAKA